LSPGVGFLLGSIVGGSLSDRSVRRYKKKRGGVRLPEDRLNGSLLMILIILPVSTILYGWSVEKEFGGLGLPIAGSFIQGFALMGSFSGLNTYAAGELGCLGSDNCVHH
jgi:MFS family permease